VGGIGEGVSVIVWRAVGEITKGAGETVVVGEVSRFSSIGDAARRGLEV
jgi:hypothetical protein